MVAIPQKSEVVSDRIELLKSLPFGQRMIRAGFKSVSYKDLMDRLGCTAVNERNENKAKRRAQYIAFVANKAQEEKRLKSLFKIKRKPYKVFHNYDLDDGEWFYSVGKKYNYLWDYTESIPESKNKKRFYGYISYIEYEIEFITLEDYSEDKIPARCLRNVKLAKNLGAEYLWVAKPQLSIPDPIIIATRENVFEEDDDENNMLRGPYYEIDMWE